MFFEDWGSGIARRWAIAPLQAPHPWPVYVLQALVASALVLSVLLIPQRTSLAPAVFVEAGILWVVSSILRAVWEPRQQSSGATGGLFNLTTLFFAVVSATFTVHGLDIAPDGTASAFGPNNPDPLPGLLTNLSIYYLVLHGVVVVFVTSYSRDREREMEAGLALLVVYSSLLFERVLRLDMELPLLWGPLLVLLAQGIAHAGSQAQPWWRVPRFGGPVLAFLAAGVITTITAVYVYGALTMLARIGGFALLFWLIANTIGGQRQVRLFWLAIVGPLAGAAIVILFKLWEVGQEMGWTFALGYRYQVLGVSGPNPAGLSLGIAILLVLGAIVVQRTWRAKLLLGVLLIPLVPAFLAPHSPSGLVALAGGLLSLVVLRYGRIAFRSRRRTLTWVAAASAAAVVGIALIVLTPDPYTNKVIGDVTDPTTGRGSRVISWGLSIRDIANNPVVGVGLGDYYARTQYVPDFPSSVMTRVAERRLLLGGDGEYWKVFVIAHPHNAFLAIQEGTGILGLGVVIWLLSSLGREAWRLMRQANGSLDWWVAAVPTAGVGMVLAWSFVAQGEDITMLGLPFWPLLGLMAGCGSFVGDQQPRTQWWLSPFRAQSGPLRRLTSRLRADRNWPRLSGTAVMFAGAAAITIAFLGMVARPVLAQSIEAQARETTSLRETIDRFELARKFDPLNAAYLVRLGALYLWVEYAGRTEQALQTYERLIQVRRDYAPDHVKLGLTYWLNGDIDDAIRELETAVRLDPWNALGSDNHTVLALSYMASGRRDEAIGTFAAGFLVAPQTINDPVWQRVGGDPVLDPAYLPGFGYEERRTADLRRRLGVAVPEDTQPAGVAPLQVLTVTEVLESIYQDYKAELPSDPARAHGMLSVLARLYADIGRPDRTVALLQELKLMVPNESHVHYDLGLAYLELGDVAAAKRSFEEVIALAEDSRFYDVREPFAHFQLGQIYLDEADAEKAVVELRAALDTYRRWAYFPHAYDALATAESLTGHPDEAERLMDRLDYLLGR